MWCKNNCDGNPAKFRKKMSVFLDYIQFKYIPCDVLVKDVYPLKIVPNFTMIKALAHQVGTLFCPFFCQYFTFLFPLKADPTIEEFPSLENLALSPTPSPCSSPQHPVSQRGDTDLEKIGIVCVCIFSFEASIHLKRRVYTTIIILFFRRDE